MESYRKIYPSEFYKKFLIHGVRPDGRSLNKTRKTKITTGSISTADGSSFIKMGNTSVIAGVIAEIGPPTSTTDAKKKNGEIYVNLEMNPICSPRIRSGRPPDEAQENSEFLTKLIKELKIVDWEGIYVESDKKIEDQKYVWHLYVDLYVLNHDGNIKDASLIATLFALNNTSLPAIKIENDQVLCDAEKPKTKLKITQFPIPSSFAIVEDSLIVDPTSEEEELSKTTLTILINEKKFNEFVQKRRSSFIGGCSARMHFNQRNSN